MLLSIDHFLDIDVFKSSIQIEVRSFSTTAIHTWYASGWAVFFCMMRTEISTWDIFGTGLFANLLPASFVPLDKEELRDSAVSGRFILLPVLLRVRTAPDPEELDKDIELF